MNVRAIAAVVVGIVAWFVLFMVVGIAFGFLWGDYRAAASVFFANGDFSHFTIAMMITNFVVFIVAGAVDGRLVWIIGKNRVAVMVVAGLFLLYALFEHYYLLWGQLPDWYNVIMPWIIAGSIFLGGRLQKTGAVTAK
jgi:hypothetical protein